MAKCDNPQHTRRADGRCVQCMKAAQQRHYRANNPQYKQRAARWQTANRDRRAAIQRKNKYGDIPRRPELCDLCRHRKPRCVDHDHATGKFRGWLCYRCNTGLGALGDNTAGLLIALAYLQRATC